ncbi:helix-turn-helix domain-containing protein [Leptolyngbya iicbica]|uniref:Helix-turn-helix domain-containing protein n=2 Tax=Cyanophyceae TaxID=3028117 RepID=A0A4Q7EEG6_9CYAN|nr:RodZ domain-containing protein [Leptolyngbya sp. LK]RZM79665.1 helix-turn-helix domain-containing protein [Leptolyngbya sp. LK]
MNKPAQNINQLHREQLVYIGQILRETREAAGLSQAALAEKTLIRLSLLNAIEVADISQLPEPVYTRGLIRRYGDSLGLDGEALAIQYFTPATQKKPSRSFWRLPITPQLRPVHLYVTYVVLIGVAISALSYTLQRMSYQNSTLPVLEGEVAEEAMMPEGGPGSEEAESPTAPEAPAVPAEVADAPVRVTVQLQEQSWLRITTDGTVTFEGILKEGDSKIWTAEEQLRIRAGNAGGVRVSFNEGNAEVLGQPGTVAEATYPPNNTAQLPRR